MNDSVRRLVLLAAAFAVVACVPEALGPSRASGSPGIVTPSPAPTGPTPSPSFVPPTPTPMPTFLAYRVARGDNLTSIARQFRTSGRSIAFWNRGTYPSLDPDSATYAPNRIEVGWTLVLIPGVKITDDDLPEPTETLGPSPDA
jgi:hypothetical protein